MESPNTIPVVQQAMKVIAAIADGRARGVSISGLSKSLGLSNATGYRIVQTLLAGGWIEPSPAGGFELGGAMLPLLSPLLMRRQLLEIARPILENLARDTGLSCKLVTRQGDHAVTALRADSPTSRMAVTSPVGSRFSLCYGAGGAALLAGSEASQVQRIIDHATPDVWKHQTAQAVLRRIDDILKQGWTADIGGFHPAVAAIGAPVAGTHTAIVMMGWPEEFAQKRLPALSAKLLSACRELVDRMSSSEGRP